MRLSTKSVLLSVACVSLVGCTTTSLTVALNVVADAASLAVITAPLLAATGVIPPITATLIVDYAGQVSEAVVKVDAVLASSSADSVKITTIVSDFAAVIVPDIPGAPTNAVALITAISGAINIFITQLQQTFGANAALAAHAATGKPVKPYRMSWVDRRNVGKALNTAKDTIAKAAAWKAAHPK